MHKLRASLIPVFIMLIHILQGLKRSLPADDVTAPVPKKKTRISLMNSSGRSTPPPLPPGSGVFIDHVKGTLKGRPHLFFNTKKKLNVDDLGRLWKKMWEGHRKALDFVDWVKSDLTGTYVAFHKSGDGILAARDCRIECFAYGWDCFELSDIIMKWGDFDCDKTRVPKRYTPLNPY